MSADSTFRTLRPMHRLAARFPNPRAEFTAETLEWREGRMTRGPSRLPVTW